MYVCRYTSMLRLGENGLQKYRLDKYRVGRKKRSNFEAVLLINYTTEKLQIWMV